MSTLLGFPVIEAAPTPSRKDDAQPVRLGDLDHYVLVTAPSTAGEEVTMTLAEARRLLTGGTT